MRQSDEQLIINYLDGDEKAIGLLVDRYLTDIFNFAFKLTSDKQAAEDITQESFIKAWKNIRGFRRKSSFQTWLFSIARNSAIDWLRKKKEIAFSAFEKADGTNPIAETIVDRELLPDELITQAEDIQFVQSILTELNPIYSEVLTLRYSSNLTFEEIGKILKRPIHTVKSQHRRALIALRRVLETRPI
jgi:RNA polymerase sigma-70 factor, ECF subfamily